MSGITIEFPDIARPVFPLSEEWEDIGISNGFEDGTEQSRARFTRSRGKWVLTWTALSDPDYQKLMNFWRFTVKGKSAAFNWTNPVGGRTHTVRFLEKQPFKYVAPGFWSGEVTIREV
jgi:hypothetical protein